MVAALTRRFGDLDIAEEAAAEAFAAAVGRWPADGVPPSPGAWLATTANRKAIDRIRRENKRGGKQQQAQLVYGNDPPGPAGAIGDERLRLIFTCCHPALSMQARVALTLCMVGARHGGWKEEEEAAAEVYRTRTAPRDVFFLLQLSTDDGELTRMARQAPDHACSIRQPDTQDEMDQRADRVREDLDEIISAARASEPGPVRRHT
jgi:hypothetical protein